MVKRAFCDYCGSEANYELAIKGEETDICEGCCDRVSRTLQDIKDRVKDNR